MAAACHHVFDQAVASMTMSTLPQESRPICVDLRCIRCGQIERYVRSDEVERATERERKRAERRTWPTYGGPMDPPTREDLFTNG